MVIEDEASIASAVAARLRSEGFRVEVAADGPSGVELCEQLRPDLVVLDLMLPGLDGLEVCRQVQRDRPVPVVMLTARDSETDILVGLAVGADDYVTKPFSPRELVARVHTVLRRAERALVYPGTIVRVGDLEIDPASRRVRKGDEEIHLTPTEFDLLAWMASAPGHGAHPRPAPGPGVGLPRRLRRPHRRLPRAGPAPQARARGRPHRPRRRATAWRTGSREPHDGAAARPAEVHQDEAGGGDRRRGAGDGVRRVGGTGAGMSAVASALLAGALALGLVQILARGMTSPLREMADAAAAMARGDYGRRVTATSRDEVGELARAFNAMAVQLAEVDRVRRDLVANVSHELRTPITALRANLENLVDGVEQPDAETLRTMLRQTERLGALVAQLLDLSRLESGAVPLQRRTFAVEPVLEDAASESRLHAPGVEVSVLVESPEPVADGDPARVHQVVANLLDNAVRYSPPGGTVELSARRGKGTVTIEVRDHGPGISEEDSTRVFERFYRADAVPVVGPRRGRPRTGHRPVDRRPPRGRDPGRAGPTDRLPDGGRPARRPP